ncbi:hypothetical protein ACWFRN_22640, partial [Streptomyces celluloflavus]
MTSFQGIGPTFGFLQSTVWRTALALVVVFVMLALTGWTAVRSSKEDANPLATAKAAWRHATFLGRPLPDPQGTPAALRAFFSSLDRAEKQELATRYPLVVGNMDGAPVTLRYSANRMALDQAGAIARQRMDDHRLTPVGRQGAGRGDDRLQTQMRAHRAMR